MKTVKCNKMGTGLEVESDSSAYALMSRISECVRFRPYFPPHYFYSYLVLSRDTT